MDALERTVAEIRRAGAQRWPELELDDAALRALAPEAPPAHPADLYLAIACVAGLPGAFAAFEAEAMPVVERTVRALGAGADVVDEVVQHVRTVALVERGDRPSVLATYRGDGSLGSWVRIIATRHALRCLRASREHRLASDDELLELVAPQGDPELAAIRSSCRAELQSAFRAAVARLPRRERSALRLSVLDGLSIDAIGRLYAVHRATAARWLERARAQLARDTRAALRARLALSGDEIDSIIRSLGSRLDISIATALASEAGP